MKQVLIPIFICLSIMTLLSCNKLPKDKPNLTIPTHYQSEAAAFRIDTLAKNLKIPFAIDWLPDGKVIFTERKNGQINLLDLSNGKIQAIGNLPKVYNRGDGGMLDVLVHPDYKENGWIYFAYSHSQPDTFSTTIVERAKLKDNQLIQREKIFEALPYYKSSSHFGCRLAIQNGYLFFGIGDRYRRDSAQILRTHNGKIIRLHENGAIPKDNPFVDIPKAKPEIWSYGHRNPQGLTIHPKLGTLWIHEHGPQGGDEVNVIKKGKNYGWPIITYGEEYGGGAIGGGIAKKEGLEQPFYYYRPSIAPSGMDFYEGTAFPNWRGNLFIGGMFLEHINRLVIENKRVIHEERILEAQKWRVRFVKTGPDGFLYFGVDEGYIFRLVPDDKN